MCCNFSILVQMYITKSESLKRNWKKLRNTKKMYSDLSVGKIIKKQTGGLKQQAQISAVN